MTWYKKVLIEQKSDLIRSIIVSLIVTIIFSIWNINSKDPFIWQKIEPISQPSILARALYSAFVFVTLGSFLYYVIKLWKIVYFVCVKIIGSLVLYKHIKSLIWASLILITYFYIFPTIVNILNTIISTFYNILMFSIYISPIFGIFVISIVIFKLLIFYTKNFNKNPKFTNKV